MVSYIYIGEPIKSNLFGTKPRIQLNDQFGRVEDIPAFITSERQKRDEFDRRFLTTSLKVDQDISMGTVTDVKQELRKSGAFRINYSVRKVENEFRKTTLIFLNKMLLKGGQQLDHLFFICLFVRQSTLTHQVVFFAICEGASIITSRPALFLGKQ